MAQIDPSIALNVRQPDPVGAIGRGLKLADMYRQQGAYAAEDAAKQAAAQQEQQVAEIYRASLGDGGQLDRQRYLSGLGQAGMGGRAMAEQEKFGKLDKQSAEASNLTSQVKERDLTTARKKLEALGGVTHSLLSKPDATPDDALRGINQLVEIGVMTPQEGAQAYRQIPTGSPQEFRAYLVQSGMAILDAGKRLDALTPKLDVVNLGGSTQIVDVNPNTRGEAPTSFKRTMTPGEAATDARSRERLAFDREQGSNQFVPVEGVGLFVGNKRTGEVRPVTGPGGAQITPQKPPPQFAIEGAQQAVRAMTTIDNALGLLETPAGKRALGLKNLAPGAVGRAAINTTDPKGVDTRAAIAEIGSAQIKDRSGATVTIGEEPRLMPFIPVPTDSPDVAAKKLRRLREAIDKDYQTLGEFYPGVKKAGQPTPAPSGAPKAGAAVDGYVFLGGDPADQKNWKKQ